MGQRYSIIRSKSLKTLSRNFEIRDDSELHKNHGNIRRE